VQITYASCFAYLSFFLSIPEAYCNRSLRSPQVRWCACPAAVREAENDATSSENLPETEDEPVETDCDCSDHFIWPKTVSFGPGFRRKFGRRNTWQIRTKRV